MFGSRPTYLCWREANLIQTGWQNHIIRFSWPFGPKYFRLLSPYPSRVLRPFSTRIDARILGDECEESLHALRRRLCLAPAGALTSNGATVDSTICPTPSISGTFLSHRCLWVGTTTLIIFLEPVVSLSFQHRLMPTAPEHQLDLSTGRAMVTP